MVMVSPGYEPHGAFTDFGREMSGSKQPANLRTALRARSEAVARADARRFHVLMSGAGFAIGLAFVIPVVLWLSGGSFQSILDPLSSQKEAGEIPVLASAAPTRLPQQESLPNSSAAAPNERGAAGTGTTANAVVPPAPAAEHIARARSLFRSGDIAGARRLLNDKSLALNGEALFLLAETWDPNVLAALGVKGAIAEAETARRLYAAARDKGMSAAVGRLEALH